jgi:hypothetical protein
MRNLTTLQISEGEAMQAIFDACRDNPERLPKGLVTFRPTINGHEAALRNVYGVVVALADVDEFDV